MNAEIRTLEKVFGDSVQLQVPLYQRPYVWTLDKQWEPLWSDVQSVADRLRELLASGKSPKKAQAEVSPHFMGAVVLQEIHTAIGEMDRYTVIDGQQRLTTLQLLLDATLAAFSKHADIAGGALLANLVVNGQKVTTAGERFKLWPTNTDRAAFRAVMKAAASHSPSAQDAGVAQAAGKGGEETARVALAHQFFVERVDEWLSEAANDPTERKWRVEALTTVLLGKLTMVAIELDKDENAQVIFETLNARNTPLLASDLVKNVLFQRIEEDEPGKSQEMYEEYWQKLDTDSWRKEVRQGRLLRPRLDLFLYYWLIMQSVKAVSTHEVFTKIRAQLEDGEDGEAATEPRKILESIAKNAAKYDGLEKADGGSRLGTFRYRVIQVMQTEAVTPVLLYLYDPMRTPVPQEQIDRALLALESWAVRRMLCRLTAKDYNKQFLELIKAVESAGRAVAGDAIVAALQQETADASFWPSDATVASALASSAVYRILSRARLRMVLEAVEDHLRTEYAEQKVDRSKYTIEHVLPQTWEPHWPLPQGVGSHYLWTPVSQNLSPLYSARDALLM